jgi:hypothetical protein
MLALLVSGFEELNGKAAKRDFDCMDVHVSWSSSRYHKTPFDVNTHSRTEESNICDSIVLPFWKSGLLLKIKS